MIENIITIRHDAFGRYEIVRRLVPTEDRGYCAWCGSPARFNYGIWNEGIYTKPDFDDTQFCSIGCRNIYHT